jgi:hypothetical protein
MLSPLLRPPFYALIARNALPRLNSSRSMSSQPVNLVSVNTAPDRAKKVIGAVIDNVKDKYSIVHAGNSTSERGRAAGSCTAANVVELT